MARRNLACLKKKAVNEGRRFVYIDEASVSVSSFIGYTYARCGKPPVFEINTGITDRLYLASGISEKGDLVYQIRKQPFDGKAIVEFLKQMLTELSGKLLIVWDKALRFTIARKQGVFWKATSEPSGYIWRTNRLTHRRSMPMSKSGIKLKWSD